MAKIFDPSGLPPTDQAAYNAWRQKAQSYLQGGALPAEISYVLAHPEYLRTHPQLQDAYNTLTGASLPPSVKSAVQSQLGDNTNFDWSGGQAGIGKHKGLWSQPETWIQIALGGALGGAAAGGAFSGAGGSAAGGSAAGGSAAGGSAAGGTAAGGTAAGGTAAGGTAAGGTAAGGTAAGGFPWGKVVEGGLGAFGAWYAAHKQSQGIDKAIAAQQAASQQAIDLQKQALKEAQAAVGPAMSMFGPGAPGSGATTGAPVGPLGVPQGQFGTLGDVYGKIVGAQLQNLGPYTSLGGGAAGALGFGLGLPGFQGGTAPMPASAMSPPTLPNMTDRMSGPMRPASELDAQGYPLASLLPPPGSAGPPTAGGTTTSGQVPMRAPDGSIKSVPADQVAYWKAKGATFVGLTS